MRNENKHQNYENALFTMTIEIDGGRVGVIPIYEDSIPEKLAQSKPSNVELPYKQISFFIMEHKHKTIVEEDEENQTSGQRGDMHSRSESNINKVNEFIPTDINNNSKCGSNSNSKQHHHQQYNYKC